MRRYALPVAASALLLADPDPTRSLVVVVKIGEKKEARTIPFEEAQSTIDKELATKQRIELTGKLRFILTRMPVRLISIVVPNEFWPLNSSTTLHAVLMRA